MAGQVEVEEVEKRVGSGQSSGAVLQLFLDSQPRADKTKMLSKLTQLVCIRQEKLFNVEATHVVGGHHPCR